jgi:hypothetical protein
LLACFFVDFASSFPTARNKRIKRNNLLTYRHRENCTSSLACVGVLK